GLSPLSAKQARFFAPCASAAIVRPFLADLLRQHRPGMPVNDMNWIRSGQVALVNGRWLPPGEPPEDLDKIGPYVATIGGDVAGAVLPPVQLAGCTPENLVEFLERWKRSLPRREAGGFMMARPWDLIDRNGQQIECDYLARGEKGPSARPMDFSLVGPAGR